MVTTESVLQTATGKRIPLKQNLNCKNYGIYVATCLECNEQYVGQTINKFSKRWAGHRATWKKFDCNVQNEQASLLIHYTKLHPSALNNYPVLSQCFKVTFVDQPPQHLLDKFENQWQTRIKATINISKMIIPFVK